MWRSRRLSKLVYSVRRKYACFKMSIKENKETDKDDSTQKKQIEISCPIPINKFDEVHCVDEDGPGLDKHNSYRDLREPLDDEIEIYSREKGSKFISTVEKNNDSPGKVFVKMEQKSCPSDISSAKGDCTNKANVSKDSADKNKTKIATPDKIKNLVAKGRKKLLRDSKTDKTVANKTAEEKMKMSDTVKVSIKNEVASEKPKVTGLSETFSDKWNKLSSASQKFSGTIREQLQKRKTQLQKFHNGSSDKSNAEKERKVSKKGKINDGEVAIEDPPTQFIGQIYSPESYFVGDEHDYKENVHCSVNDAENTKTDDDDISGDDEDDKQTFVEVENVENEDAAVDEFEPAHCVGNEECPCFVCKSGNACILRRRSSSVPPADRRKVFQSETLQEQNMLSRYSTSSINPNENDANSNDRISERKGNDIKRLSPNFYPVTIHNLSLMSLERVEHYV